MALSAVAGVGEGGVGKGGVGEGGVGEGAGGVLHEHGREVTSFGGGVTRWLADKLLPTLEELYDACYIVSDNDEGEPNGDGSSWCICVDTTPSEATCVAHAELGVHYGEPVYLCRLDDAP